jgi:lipid-A-disaccharide synthase
MSRKKNVMIIAGEASGDLHGARLVSAMLTKEPELSFCGMGGKELAAVGVELLFEAKRIAVVGIAEVVTHLPDIFRAQKTLKARMKEDRPDLLILIDFPDFNFMLAKYAKKLGIPIYYYISPQVWAWRPGRVATLKKLVDKIGVILPFEEQFFRDRGVAASYVGHPLLDSVQSDCSKVTFCNEHTIDPNSLLIGLLPGSRKKEIASLLPVLLQTAQKVQNESAKKVVFLLPVASTLSKEEVLANGVIEYGKGLELQLITENRYDMMAACDAALVVSGTVTLELALLDTPMVVFYKVSPATYRIGKLFLNKNLKYFSLVNLIADDAVVPELSQENVNPDNLYAELSPLLLEGSRKEKMLDGLALVRERMGTVGASAKSAELALSLIV